MNGDGLVVTTREFMSMPLKKQMTLLFENTEYLKKAVMGYKFHQRIQYVIGGLMASGIMYLLYIHIH